MQSSLNASRSKGFDKGSQDVHYISPGGFVRPHIKRSVTMEAKLLGIVVLLLVLLNVEDVNAKCKPSLSWVRSSNRRNCNPGKRNAPIAKVNGKKYRVVSGLTCVVVCIIPSPIAVLLAAPCLARSKLSPVLNCHINLH